MKRYINFVPFNSVQNTNGMGQHLTSIYAILKPFHLKSFLARHRLHLCAFCGRIFAAIMFESEFNTGFATDDAKAAKPSGNRSAG